MKLRTLAALSLIIFCLSFSGCGKVWFVDFTDTVLADDFFVDGGSADSMGLVLDEGYVSSLVAFEGDFTVTIIFDLFVNASLDAANFTIALADGISEEPNNFINNWGRGLGNPANEEYGVRDFNYLEITPRYLIDEDAAFPGINRSGQNKWVLEKEGSHVKITMNETSTVAEFDISHYQGSEFHVSIYGKTWNAGVLRFKSIKVEYFDSIILP